MQSFNLGALADWRYVLADQAISFEIIGDFRRISFDVMTDVDTLVNVLFADGQFMTVARGVGLLEIAFTVDQEVAVNFSEPVWVRTKDRPQLIDESEEASWASVEPRGDAQDQQFRRMVQLMNRNIELRLAEQRAEFDRRLQMVNASQSLPAGADAVIEPGADNE